MRRVNRWLAVKITKGVGTMWCAYAFAVLALWGLPAALQSGSLVAWFAQTFLQLVLLSILAVGQQVTSEQVERHGDRVQRHLQEHSESLHQRLSMHNLAVQKRIDEHGKALHARLDEHHARLAEIHHHVTKPRPSGRTRKETAP